MIRKKRLEILLSKLDPIPEPRLEWESYMLDAGSAAKIIYIASFVYGDIRGKNVIDLGCGSGILAVGASIAGARWVVGVDVDKKSIEAAKRNASKVSADVDLVAGDISCVTGHFDTVLMNPPFGAWKRGADVYFLEKALQIGDVIYSLHKGSESVRNFLSSKIPDIGGHIDKVYSLTITIRRTFSFHRMRRYSVNADLYRIIRKASDARSKANM
ncbi:MAG: METTL5 family protein [Nitrososphaerota archaeon]|nr:METTL5 family protein [Candidatus Bathyarchaeota archaeon]MDW8048090.1 METTL5 family protein [Nitrososphaerota archaeon]